MMIVYQEEKDKLVEIHRKLEQAFPDELIVPFQSVMSAIEYMEKNSPIAVYSEVEHSGEILISAMKKRELDCYCAYISAVQGYKKKPWTHLGSAMAFDYFDFKVTSDKLKEMYVQWVKRQRRNGVCLSTKRS